MKREVVLDTETTGLDHSSGDRVVELGCVELINHVPTGRHFHAYLNPERPMTDDAFGVHGLSDAFLADKPLFRDIAVEFIHFIGDATLIIHNAPFDIGFLNFELERCKLPRVINEVIDTVELARTTHPGARVSLDALCRFYGIDNSHRTLHGALLDAEILAEVYLELIGGRQVSIAFAAEVESPRGIEYAAETYVARQRPVALPRRITEAEIAAHRDFVRSLGPHALWSEYLERIES